RRFDRPLRIRGGRVSETMKGAVTSGDRIGHYRVLETLGEGGMGVVYLGADSEGRNVAIKVLRPAVAGTPRRVAGWPARSTRCGVCTARTSPRSSTPT